MDLPIVVSKIEAAEQKFYEPGLYSCKCGDMVAVRPCAEKFKEKTFLGVYMGDIPLSLDADFKDGTLTISRSMYNPMIFIPEKNEVVFGCESWWGKISDERQLKQITDEDIENVWYVKALRQLQAK